MKCLLIPSFILLNCILAKGQETGKSMVISHLTSNFYIYTTFGDYKGAKIPANGMYVVTGEGVILIDTPWDTTQFQPLLDSIVMKHGQKVKLVIATHFHEDRTAGLEFYRNKGIRTYTTILTDLLSRKHGMKRAEFLIENDTTISLGQYSFQTFYPGHGHTEDNIVIWFDNERVLYGGCLIKSYRDKSLGNLGDANIDTYAQTVMNVKSFYNPLYVIPGHGDWLSSASLEHTYIMAKRLRKEQNE